MISQLVDGLIGAISPKRGLERATYRNALNKVRSYDGGSDDRRTAGWNAGPRSGESGDLLKIQRSRWRAWDLYDNSVYARKIVRALIAQTIGLGLKPESAAVNPEGQPDSTFRRLSKELWDAWAHAPSNLGAPGYGGVTFNELERMAFREVILSGEVLVRLIERTVSSPGKPLPFEVEIISCERLAEDSTLSHSEGDNFIYRGIEFDPSGRRVAYHLYNFHPQDPRPVFLNHETTRIPADEIIHLYVPERPDHVRGVSWFAPLLLQLRNVDDYQENELTAAAVGACVVAGITRAGAGGTGAGLNTPAGGDSTDKDGNRVTRMQPGMFFELDVGEKIEGFNPQRPNGNAEAFIALLLRSLAGALPGLKASTVTMDYRNSSFSSERSADNDCWRETEQIQQWFEQNFCQPIWDRVIESGVSNGFFEDMDFRSFGLDKFGANRRRYLAADWEGPIAKSINPVDDVTAANMRVESNLSSPQAECRNIGTNLKENLAQKAEYFAELETAKLPNQELLKANTEKAKAAALLEPPPPAGPSKRNRYVGPDGEDLSNRRIA